MDARLPALPKPRRQPLSPKLPKTFAARPTGPRIYSQPGEAVVGFGPPPGGWGGPVPEWKIYAAIATTLKDPLEYRKPPFFGGVSWAYQSSALGRYRRQAGSAVVDYVIYLPGDLIGIRLQSQRFHIGFGPQAQAYDEQQRGRLNALMRVVDLYEADFINDPTDQAVVIKVKEAMRLIERISPIAGGTATARG